MRWSVSLEAEGGHVLTREQVVDLADAVAEIGRLRQQPGRTLQTWGSTDALQTLMRNDLIDEYRLFIFPVVLGSGKRLFGSGTVPVALKQVESVTSSKGATYHKFERSGKPEYGRMGS